MWRKQREPLEVKGLREPCTERAQEFCRKSTRELADADELPEGHERLPLALMAALRVQSAAVEIGNSV
jgi:hypothetical protein